MIIHLFNSSVVSGPERLVLPALAETHGRFMIVNLRETRREAPGRDPLEALSRSLRLPYAAIPVAGRWDRAAIGRLRERIAKEKPELVHAHVGKASVYLARAVRGLDAPPRIVSTHHGVRGLPDLKTKAYELAYRRLFLPRFDRVLCVSTEDLETVRRSGVADAKLRLHLNGVDGFLVEPCQRRAESARVRAAWLPDEPARDRLFLLGVVGRLSAEKDHARLLRVLARLEKSGAARDWRCLVIGAGELEFALKKAANALGLGRRVVWLGYREDAGRELAGLDLLLSFSKAEGLPVNLIEAGWAGTPVMATLVGGVKDLLPDESFGIRVPPGESDGAAAGRLAPLLAGGGNEALAAQGKRLQQRVGAEFSQKRWTSRLREIYAELGVAV